MIIAVAVGGALVGLLGRGPGNGSMDRGIDLFDARTEGSFEFSDAPAVEESPIDVHFLAPREGIADAPLLIVMPGAQRNASDYRDDWADWADATGAVVLVPEFPTDDYSVDDYNQGAVVDDDGDVRDPESWTLTVVERLFTYVVDSLESSTMTYDLFGHSAGAQFVHRFVELADHPHLRTAVAANAGWYTMPDDSVDFPYGLDGGPRDLAAVAPAFADRLVVLLGAEDIDEDDDLLRHDEGSDAQGATRLERGLNFYQTARDAAESVDADFSWELVVEPGIAHDHTRMSRAAQRFFDE